MSRLYALVGETRKNLSVPILIGIDVDYNNQGDALFVLRNFLHRLRRIHQRHFVRFVTDTLWAMESDNTHLFYAHDGPKERRCDVVWTIKIVGSEQVEVLMTKTGSTDRETLLVETSIKLKRFVSGVENNADHVAIVQLMHRFYGRLGQLHHIRLLEEDFHVMMVPSFNNKGYYSLPLYGMSYFDAKRKFSYIKSQMEYTQRCYYDTLPDPLVIGDVFYTTLKLIQDNSNFGVARNTRHDTYNLAEQLFAVFAGYQQIRQSPHDVILFSERDSDNFMIDTYRSSMDDIEENLSC